MPSNGCSGGTGTIIRWFNQYVRRVGPHPPAFTYCCDAHDLFYEQGAHWQGYKNLGLWFQERWDDRKWRSEADRILRECIYNNLEARGRSAWVKLHVPWIFWFFVRAFGWLYWGRG